MLDKKINKLGIILVVLALLVVIPGCTSQSAADKAYNYLEKAATQEGSFNQQQEPLIQVEKKEQDAYKKIMAMDLTKYNQIKENSDQALKYVDQREKLLEREKQSIDEAYSTFKKAVPYLKKVDNKEAKPYADQMIDDMKKRYQAFGDLYQSYKKSVDLDRELFNLLKDKNLTKDELSKQLNKVNEAYKQIEKQKDVFNRLTQSFNNEKKQFYKIFKLGNE